MQDQKDKTDLFLQRRRHLLKLGAAGMPMILTLRASAQQAIISQLRCVITLPGSLKILVNDSGAAWIGDGSLEEVPGSGGWTSESIDNFKADADLFFPDGSAPVAYRPDACPPEQECDDDSGDDDDDDLLSHLSDQNGTYAMNDYLAGGGSGDDDDSCGDDDDDGGDDDSGDDDGHGHSGVIDCGFACYEFNSGYTLKPGDHVSGSGFSQTGDDGLFLALAVIYADDNPGGSAYPGISCIVSVLNYIGA